MAAAATSTCTATPSTVCSRARRRSPERALFVCTHNSARSQLAAALWTQLTDQPAESAGTHPAERVHRGAVAAARRAGLDLSDARPKLLDDVEDRPALVVTVCDRAHEELDPDPTWLHWSVPDPVAAPSRAAFDATVAELRDRITHARRRVDEQLGPPARDRHRPATARPCPDGWSPKALGTGLLVVAVVGSGIMATRLSPDDVGLQLLENAAATAGALDRPDLDARRRLRRPLQPRRHPRSTAASATSQPATPALYIVAQIVGGCLGAMVANLMFDLPAIDWSTKQRSSGALWLSEVVATVGLLLVIHGCVRSGRANVVAVAVGVWIGGAYWFTSSTSFANPAVTIARTLSDTFAGIKPSSAPMFIVMQLIGAAIAFALIRFLYPHDADADRDPPR